MVVALEKEEEAEEEEEEEGEKDEEEAYTETCGVLVTDGEHTSAQKKPHQWYHRRLSALQCRLTEHIVSS